MLFTFLSMALLGRTQYKKYIMSEYFIGIDAGATGSRCRLTDENGKKLASVESGPTNGLLGAEIVRNRILEMASSVVEEAGLDESILEKTTVLIGMAGVSRSEVVNAILEYYMPFKTLCFSSDAQIAQAGAFNGGDGGIVIVGTGSVAYVKKGDYEQIIGGYGFPISDEGSGAWLGLRAMQMSLRAQDGRIEESPFTKKILSFFPDNRKSIIAWMDNSKPKRYAEFAPTVISYATEKDPVAETIVKESAEHIENYIRTVYAKGVDQCVLMGGVGPSLLPWLDPEIVKGLSEPLGNSVDGAILIARS